MKAVILAAGSSTRLYPLTRECPKCLLDVGGTTLLEHQLRALAACHIDEVVVVVGYLSEMIRHAVEQVHVTVPLTFVHNPDYATTNNLYSLWMARDWLRDSAFVCLHADVLFHPWILQRCLSAEPEICLAVDQQIHQETMKVAIESGRVTQIGKGIEPEAISGTFLGMAKCSAPAGQMVLQETEVLVALGQTQRYFTAAIERLISKGIPVGFSWTDGLPWIEIDFAEELERARREVYPEIIRLEGKAL